MSPNEIDNKIETVKKKIDFIAAIAYQALSLLLIKYSIYTISMNYYVRVKNKK